MRRIHEPSAPLTVSPVINAAKSSIEQCGVKALPCGPLDEVLPGLSLPKPGQESTSAKYCPAV